MQLCYLDESGTPDIPGNTSHYILCGLAIPIWHWTSCERDVGVIRKRYGLEDKEIHIAWMMRCYLEQSKITNFASMSHAERRQKMETHRIAELLRLQSNPTTGLISRLKRRFGTLNLTFTSHFRSANNLLRNWLSALLDGDLQDYTPNASIR
jgi:hypothetical protein